MKGQIGLFGIVSVVLVSGCGWVDSTGKQSNIAPRLNELVHVVVENSEAKSVGVVDADLNLRSADSTLLQEASAAARQTCLDMGGSFQGLQTTDFANSLEDACDPTLSETCALNLEAEILSSELWLSDIPAVRRPVAQRYSLYLQDTDGATSTQEMTLCIASLSTPPIASEDSFTVQFDTQRDVDGMLFDGNCAPDLASGVLSNDSDDFDFSEDDPNDQRCLVAELTTPPQSHIGDFELKADGGFSYFSGEDLPVGGRDTFGYRVFDGLNHSEEVMVEIIITGDNEPPETVDPELQTDEDTPLIISPDALATDPELGAINVYTAGQIDAPSHGVVEILAASGEIVYTPDPNFSGFDSFSYTVEDLGGELASGVATIDVVEINDAPEITLISADTSIELPVSTEPTSLYVVVSDVEDDSAGIFIPMEAVSSDTDVLSVMVFDVDDQETGANRELVLEGLADGYATITLTALDSAALESVELTIDVTVGEGNQPPTIQAPVPNLSAVLGVPLQINIVADLFADDPDGPNSELKISSVANTTGGSVSFSIVEPLQVLTFIGDEEGLASFLLTIEDAFGNTTSTEVSIDVTAALGQDDALQSDAGNRSIETEQEPTSEEAVSSDVPVEQAGTADGTPEEASEAVEAETQEPESAQESVIESENQSSSDQEPQQDVVDTELSESTTEVAESQSEPEGEVPSAEAEEGDAIEDNTLVDENAAPTVTTDQPISAEFPETELGSNAEESVPESAEDPNENTAASTTDVTESIEPSAEVSAVPESDGSEESAPAEPEQSAAIDADPAQDETPTVVDEIEQSGENASVEDEPGAVSAATDTAE